LSPRLKLALAVGALFVYVVAGLGVLAVAVSSDLRPGEREVLEGVLDREASLAVFIGVLFLLGLGFLVSLGVSRYVVAPRRLARGAELIATANPSHRLQPSGPPELRALATAVNKLAERSEAAQGGVLGQVAAARADLEQERNRLAALVSELSLAVVVCNAGGRIVLYNRAAQELLDGDEPGSGPVGLGRSIFAILDRDVVAHALERIDTAKGGAPAPGVEVAATTSGGRLLRIATAPVRDAVGEASGFVLILEDVTETAEASLRRDTLLRGLSEDARAAVANIRAAVESMLDYPQMAAEERRRFTEIVGKEAQTLSERLDSALRESDAYFEDRWSLSDMLGADLLTAASRSLEREAGVTAEAADGGAEMWLKVDSYAIVRTIRHLAGRLRSEVAVTSFSLDLGRSGSLARLDLGWKGQGIAEERLRAWVEEPLGAPGGSPAGTVREVLERHGGEVFAQADPRTGTACLRLLVPASEPTAHRAAPVASARSSRPEFYDFDLFRAGEADPKQDQTDLDKLAFTVFDTETTGLDPSEDEIVSLGAVRIVNGRLLRQESFDRLVDPGRPVDPAATAVHGITSDILEGQPSIDEILPAFARFAQDTVLVGHNVAFDLRFLELKEPQTGVRFAQPVLDTLLLSAVVHPDEEDHSLEAMAIRLGVNFIGRHTALGDAILTGEIFLKQSRLLAAQGLRTLEEVREAARRTYLARVSNSLYAR
jgi:DNA polymerase III subunit epsilon